MTGSAEFARPHQATLRAGGDRRLLWEKLRADHRVESAPVPGAGAGADQGAPPVPPAAALAGGADLPPMPPGSGAGSGAGSGEADLTAIFGVMRRRGALIAGVTALVTALALPVVLSMERVYRAELRLLLNRPATAELAATGAGPLAPWDLTTELERLLSEPIVREVIAELHLDQRDEFRPRRPGAEGGTDMDGVIQRFHEALSIRRDGQTNVIQIGFTSRDPALSAEVPNALVRAYLARRDTQLRGQMQEAKSWMQGRIAEEHRRIEDLEREAAEYRRAHGPLSPEFQMAAVYQISALEGREFAIAQSRSEVVSKIARLDQTGSTDAAGDAGSDSALGALRRDLQMQNRELTRLLGTYGEGYAGVATLRETIAGTQADMADAAGREKRALEADRAALDLEAGAVRGQLSSVRDSLSRMGAAQIELSVMEQRTETRRAELSRLEEQLQGIATEGKLPAAEAEILSPAAVPSGPAGRGRKFWMAVALVGGFGLAVSIATALDLLDRSLRSQEQLRGIAGLRPVGLVPRRRATSGGRGVDAMLAEDDPMFAEAIGWVLRALRDEAGPAEGAPFTLMVSSALPGEGKSVLSTALAAALMRAGQRVLMVDCDLQRGTIRAQFEPEDLVAPGLSEYLAGEADLTEILHRDAATGIDWIGRGYGGAPGDWTRMADLIAQSRGRVVILDCAPVLAMRSTVELAGMADRCLMVARWGRSHRRSLELAAGRLRATARGEILVAINDVVPEQHARYGFADSDLFAPELKAYYLPRLRT